MKHARVYVLCCKPSLNEWNWSVSFDSDNHSEAYRKWLALSSEFPGDNYVMVGVTNNGYWEILCYHGGMHEDWEHHNIFGIFRFGFFTEENDNLLRECYQLARVNNTVVANG